MKLLGKGFLFVLQSGGQTVHADLPFQIRGTAVKGLVFKQPVMVYLKE